MKEKDLIRQAIKSNRECYKRRIIDRWHYVHIKRMLHKLLRRTPEGADEGSYLKDIAEGIHQVHEEEHHAKQAKEAKAIRQGEGHQKSLAGRAIAAWKRWLSRHKEG